MTMPWKVTVRAYAKINLSLRITGRRADGYHELKTVFQALALSDRLEFVPRPGPLSLRCTDRSVPADRQNLVWKAAEMLWQASGRTGDPEGVDIRLVKRIPAQGGLGGGSADAAAALSGLAAVWGVSVDRPGLAAIAARVGADVPFFLVGGTALGLGRGDEVYPLRDRGRHWVVLVMPPFGISTAEAFRWADEAPGAAGGPASGADGGSSVVADGINDLERPVVARHPEIGRLVEGLRVEGAAVAAMSGSGSTVYGLFGMRAAAEAAARRLPTLAGCRVVVTRTATASECRRMSRPATPGARQGRSTIEPALVEDRVSRIH